MLEDKVKRKNKLRAVCIRTKGRGNIGIAALHRLKSRWWKLCDGTKVLYRLVHRNAHYQQLRAALMLNVVVTLCYQAIEFLFWLVVPRLPPDLTRQLLSNRSPVKCRPSIANVFLSFFLLFSFFFKEKKSRDHIIEVVRQVLSARWLLPAFS
jgi:hypothetical protein